MIPQGDWQITTLDDYISVVSKGDAVIAIIRLDGFRDADDQYVRGHVQAVEGVKRTPGDLTRYLGGSALGGTTALMVDGVPTVDAVRKALGG